MNYFNTNKNKGFTLLEILVATAIFAMTIGMLTTLFVSALRGQEKAITSQNVQESARYAMGAMIKEIRMAKSLTQKNTTTSILDFKRDIPDIPPGGEHNISYQLSDSTLKRSVDGGAIEAIVSGSVIVSDLKFKVNDWDLTIGSANAQMPIVTILLTVESLPGKKPHSAITLESSVSLRLY